LEENRWIKEKDIWIVDIWEKDIQIVKKNNCKRKTYELSKKTYESPKKNIWIAEKNIRIVEKKHMNFRKNIWVTEKNI